MFDKTKFIPRFIDEAKEHVRRLNEGLLAMEKSPDDAEIVNQVFRSAHTIKGSSRMLRMIPISEAAHKLEDLLHGIRQRKIRLSRELSDLLFKGIDAIEGMIDRVAAGEELTEMDSDTAAVCEELERAAMGETDEALSLSDKAPAAEPAAKSESKAEAESEPGTPIDPENAAASEIPPPAAEPDRAPEAGDRLGMTARPEPKEAAVREEPSPTAARAGGACGPSAGRMPRPGDTIRISSDKLDDLIKLMGEIVSGHNRSKQRLAEILELERIAGRLKERLQTISEHGARTGRQGRRSTEMDRLIQSLYQGIVDFISAFKEDVNIEDLLTAELQDRSLKMRMLPLSTIFETFHRTVRSLARASGKEIELVVEGGETELDKKIIEKIGDPLIHMIRNSIDHGIEAPHVRRAMGKPETGLIRLSARYEGGNALIEIGDDGGGIPADLIKERVLKKKLIEESELASMPTSEVVNLIFLPGVSTAEMITNLSGRGVGMDVVKRNIEELKGAIAIQTASGAGTTIQIRLPLTMAIIHVLFVRVADMTFAAPANYVEEIVRTPRDKLISVVDRIAVRRRGQLIPVTDLAEVLNLPGRTRNIERMTDDLLILITGVGGDRLGVVVDALVNEEDMVIKSMPAHLRNLPLVSGAIVSGKNEIFNVLHMPKIIDAAREMRRRTADPEIQTPQPAVRPRILVVDDSMSTREIEKSILESYGYEVSLAGDGREGFDKARRHRYDLIITDVEMPHMDGFTLTESLRKEDAYRETPIILVTSLDREEDKQRGISVGADAYIVKGTFDQSTLLDSIQTLVG